MSRVWKARLIVVKHRRFINCQTTHSKCSRLGAPSPILPRNLCGAAYATEKLEAWACSSVCQSVSARVGVWVSVCVAASLNLHAHLVGGGRWAVGGGRGGAWRRSQPTSVLCNFRRNLHLQLKLQHKQLLLPCKQTHTHTRQKCSRLLSCCENILALICVCSSVAVWVWWCEYEGVTTTT